MGYFYLDDSKHPSLGFCLGSFVYCNEDPQDELEGLLSKHGLRPGIDEFKSSFPMDTGRLHGLREDLRQYLRKNCKIGAVLSAKPEELHLDALSLLRKMSQHPDVGINPHSVFIDQEIFRSNNAQIRALNESTFIGWTLHFEQDSKIVYGIQLADLAAHTCSIMMKDSLGLVNKSVKAGKDSGYDAATGIELGFELFASIRYRFLGQYAPYIDNDLFRPMLMVSDYGLHISDRLEPSIRTQAESRFGAVHLGCIH